MTVYVQAQSFDYELVEFDGDEWGSHDPKSHNVKLLNSMTERVAQEWASDGRYVPFPMVDVPLEAVKRLGFEVVSAKEPEPLDPEAVY